MTTELQEQIQLEAIKTRLVETIGWMESLKRVVALNNQVAREKGPLTDTLLKTIEQLRLLEMQLGFSTFKPKPSHPSDWSETPICDAMEP